MRPRRPLVHTIVVQHGRFMSLQLLKEIPLEHVLLLVESLEYHIERTIILLLIEVILINLLQTR